MISRDLPRSQIAEVINSGTQPLQNLSHLNELKAGGKS